MRQLRFLPRHTGLRVSKTWHAQSSSFLILGWDWPWQSPYKGSVKRFSPPCTTPKSSLTPTKGVLVWPCPPPLSLVYWHLRPPHPLRPSRDFPWDGCECILEKNIPVPTFCCFSFLNHFFNYFAGDSLHSFSYSPGHCRGSFLPTPADPRLSSSWQFYNFVGGAGTGAVFPTTVRNPVCTLILPVQYFRFFYRICII